MKIAIDEEPRPATEMLMQAMLRVALGAVLLAEAAASLRSLGTPEQLMAGETLRSMWQSLLVGEPKALLFAASLSFVACAVLLVTGFFSRTASALSIAAGAVAYWAVAANGMGSSYILGAHVLQFAIALLVLVLGPGRYSLDALLHERARQKAIREDDLWLRPPYVTQQNLR